MKASFFSSVFYMGQAAGGWPTPKTQYSNDDAKHSMAVALEHYKIAEETGFDWLSLEIDDYDGRLLNAQVGANYLVTKNIAVGVAYRYVDYRLGIEKDRWDGLVRYKLYGPAILLQASF